MLRDLCDLVRTILAADGNPMGVKLAARMDSAAPTPKPAGGEA